MKSIALIPVIMGYTMYFYMVWWQLAIRHKQRIVTKEETVLGLARIIDSLKAYIADKKPLFSREVSQTLNNEAVTAISAKTRVRYEISQQLLVQAECLITLLRGKSFRPEVLERVQKLITRAEAVSRWIDSH